MAAKAALRTVHPPRHSSPVFGSPEERRAADARSGCRSRLPRHRRGPRRLPSGKRRYPPPRKPLFRRIFAIARRLRPCGGAQPCLSPPRRRRTPRLSECGGFSEKFGGAAADGHAPQLSEKKHRRTKRRCENFRTRRRIPGGGHPHGIRTCNPTPEAPRARHRRPGTTSRRDNGG